MSNPRTPAVSIGVPVYDGAATLPAALDSLLQQTFTDFEVVISDNASTDGTEAICRAYAEKDARIRYVRQPENIGAGRNFAFVLQEAHAPLFMWAAADDTRSPTFLQRTVDLLSDAGAVSASGLTSDGEGATSGWMPLASAMPGARVHQFLLRAWRSNALFYGVHRTAALRSYPRLSQSFIAADWAIIIHLAAIGKILMTNQAHITIGTAGASNRPNKWAAFRTRKIEYILPLYEVSKATLGLVRSSSLLWKVRIIWRLAGLNLSALYNQAFGASYQWYRRHLRRFVRRDQRA